MIEDIQRTNHEMKLLALTEHPAWGEFVRMVDNDMRALDTISGLYIQQNRDELLREIEVRYHTIQKVREYVAVTIERAQNAIQDVEGSKNDVVHVAEPQHL